MKSANMPVFPRHPTFNYMAIVRAYAIESANDVKKAERQLEEAQARAVTNKSMYIQAVMKYCGKKKI